MKKKKIFCLLLALCLGIISTACGGGEAAKAEDGLSAEEELETAEEAEPSEEEKAALLRLESLRADADRGLFVLVNKENAVPSDDPSSYKPDDLERVLYFAKDRSEAGRYMRHEAAEAFNALSEAAAAEGHEIVVTTAFRDYAFQSTLYYNYVAQDGRAAADTYSARPGYSEHQTGLAADVSSPSVGYRLSRTYNEYPEGAWLKEHAHEYGFVIRFPDGKEGITGYIYEPWHIRYVGMTAAREIYEQDTTLEEYLPLLEAELAGESE